MNISTFLAHLEIQGLRLRRNGDDLAIKTRRGASDDAYIDLIRLNKAGLLTALAGGSGDTPLATPGDLTWVSVSREDVDETVPPAGWDHTLPADCAWSHLCQVLGPCPHVTDGRCRCQKRESPAAVVGRFDAEQVRTA